MPNFVRGAFMSMAVCLAAWSGAAPAGQELRMSQVSASDGAVGQSMDFFARLVGERTGGRIIVNTFHNAQLGGERDNVEGIQLGNLDLAVVNQSVLGNFVPEISAVDLPFVIQGVEHADRIFLGEIGRDFLSRLDGVGIKGLGIWESGFRNLTNSKRDVKSVDDVKGLRIRVMENQIHQDLWRALGADAVPMAWGDAYTAMQQGAIDGQENPTTVIDKNNVFEVNKKMAITQHCYATVFIIMSPERWASIPAGDQRIIQSALDEAGAHERALSRKMDAEAVDTLKGKGMAVTYPDRAGFAEKARSVREKYGQRFAETLKKIDALKQ